MRKIKINSGPRLYELVLVIISIFPMTSIIHIKTLIEDYKFRTSRSYKNSTDLKVTGSILGTSTAKITVNKLPKKTNILRKHNWIYSSLWSGLNLQIN